MLSDSGARILRQFHIWTEDMSYLPEEDTEHLIKVEGDVRGRRDGEDKDSPSFLADKKLLSKEIDQVGNEWETVKVGGWRVIF